MDHGIKNPDISKFALKILRENKLRELNENMPKADAFQRLCYDLLVQDFKDRGSTVRWSPYRTAGQDGAVDISGEDDLHQLFIAECKKNDSPELAENSLRELSNTLMRNLEKAGAPDSLYGAWFDPRLKKYIYCVSCCFDNLTARENFKSKVSGMLMGLAELKGLAHLEQAAENVELYSWEDLSAILSRSPFIYHQWIEYRLPPGVEGLSRLVESGRAPVYREYLSSARLAYFSRDDYVRQNPKARGLATETEILDSLLNRDIYNGCILYGEGGIGKTRLMLELGYRAEQQGWLVYKIISKSPTIETLRDLLSPGCNHLLLFDYIEESNVFETPDFFYKLVESCRDAVVKVIGNCRKSHMELSLIQYAEGFFKRDISIKNQELEQDFKNRVVSHILGDLKCFFRLDRDFYELRPAFAVFLKYLNKKYCLEKELDFREEPSFRLWLQKQLCRTYHAANYETLSAARERLYLFFILSASAATPSDALISTHEDDVLRLLKDGWLDKTTETARQGLTVVHDTVSEEILLIRLQERRELWENEIESIFAFASRHGKEALANCFTLFERVSDWFHGPGESGKPFVDKKKFSQWMFNLFYRFIEERPGECAVLKKPLVMTALMDELDNVALLVAKGAFFEEVIKDRHFGLVLALKMKHLQKQRAGYSNETMAVVAVQVKELLARWFSFNPDFLQDRYISARVIASFIMLFGINCDWGWGKDGAGESVISQVKRWLEMFHNANEASFIFQSWLDAGGEKEVIRAYVGPWLEKYPLEMETYFIMKSWLDTGGEKENIKDYVGPWLMKSWLDAGGEKEIIKAYVVPWLKKYPLEMETHFVMKSWLDAKGDKEVIKDYVGPWLKKYNLEMETSFVIQSWLDAGGEKEIIKEYVGPWLKKYPLEMETSFVMKSWLDAGGEKEVIKDYVGPWLEKYPLEMETHFVIKSWLDAGGEKEIIKAYAGQWLKKFNLEMETSFVIQSWLDAGGEKEIITAYVGPWLKKYPLEMETRFVMKSWLDAGGEKEVIKEYVGPWLKKYPLEMETHFVIKSWLDAKGEKEVIKDYVGPWLKKFNLEMETSFVIQSWLDAGGEKEVITAYVGPWLEKYPLEMETHFVIKSWLDAGGEKEVIKEYVGPWLKKYPLEMETHFVIKSWLDAKGEKEVIKEYVGPWLKKYPLEMETSFVIPSWLDAGGEKEVIKDYVGPWLKKYPLEMETGFVIKSWLKAGGNFAVLEKYIKPWLARFPLDEENTSFIINAWLHAGGNPAEVAPFVIPWLEKFSNSFEASYVIKAWFKSTKDVESIKTYAHRWLLQFKDHTQADFVIKRFCRSKDIPADILDAAVHWCRKYASEGEALFALSYLTQRHMESKILAAPWLTDVLQQWIGKKRLKEHDIDNIEAIMYSITQNRDFHRSGDNVQLRIQWFLSPHSFPSRTPTSPDYFLQKRFYFQVYCQLLLDGLIEIPGHEAEVEKFLHWVNRWHPGNKRQIRPDLETLAAQFPQHASLWKTVEY